MIKLPKTQVENLFCSHGRK